MRRTQEEIEELLNSAGFGEYSNRKIGGLFVCHSKKQLTFFIFSDYSIGFSSIQIITLLYYFHTPE